MSGVIRSDLVTRIRGKLLTFWVGEHAETEARGLLTEAADYIEDILTKDRLKTREINILTSENRALRAALVAAETALGLHPDVPAHPSDFAECHEHAIAFPMGETCPQCSVTRPAPNNSSTGE